MKYLRKNLSINLTEFAEAQNVSLHSIKSHTRWPKKTAHYTLVHIFAKY